MDRNAIVVPDYGCGNLAAVQRMCERVGATCRIARTADELGDAPRVILAGVGAFDRGMSQLRERGMVQPLLERWKAGVPMLGVCLGMQLLCRSSEEGVLPGLGWIEADVRRFALDVRSGLKVPHMAWSEVSIVRDNPLIPRDAGSQRFYFVHSYHVVCDHADDVIATAEHGHRFVAAFARGNLFGVQFHPEKSHRFGMALLGRFLQL